MEDQLVQGLSLLLEQMESEEHNPAEPLQEVVVEELLLLLHLMLLVKTVEQVVQVVLLVLQVVMVLLFLLLHLGQAELVEAVAVGVEL
jgi:hypothetical protein